MIDRILEAVEPIAKKVQEDPSIMLEMVLIVVVTNLIGFHIYHIIPMLF